MLDTKRFELLTITELVLLEGCVLPENELAGMGDVIATMTLLIGIELE